MNMKRILLLASLVSLSCAVRAETVRMFALNMNQLSNTGVSTARAGALDAFLENGETPLDFGYFYSIKAVSYFNYSHSGYTFGKNSDGKYVIAYREGFSLLKEYTGLTQDGNHPIRCFVLQDASERLYAPMFYVGNNYDKVAYWKAIWDAVDAVKSVASVSYVNLAGLVSTEPFNGVNVVVTTYTDGSKSSVKVIK